MRHEDEFTTPLKAKQRETTKRASDSLHKNMAEKAAKRAIIVTDGQVVAAKAAPAANAAADAKAAADDAKAAADEEAAADDAKAADAKAAAPGPAVDTAKAKGGGGKGNQGNK